MVLMFHNANIFNQNIWSWKTGNVGNFQDMFYVATALLNAYPTISSTPVKSNFSTALVPPLNVSGTARIMGTEQATVTFTPSIGAISYIVTSSPDQITATGISPSIRISGLSSNRAYTFSVNARNASGTSSASSASSPMTTSYQGSWKLLFRQSDGYLWPSGSNPGNAINDLSRNNVNSPNYSILSDMSGTVQYVHDNKYTFKYYDPSTQLYIIWSQTSNMTTAYDLTTDYALLDTNYSFMDGNVDNLTKFKGLSLSSYTGSYYDGTPGVGDYEFALAIKDHFPTYPYYPTFKSYFQSNRTIIELYVWD